MIDTELQDRVNAALDEIDTRIKNWKAGESELNMKLDDEWDFEDEIQEAAIEAALDQLRSVRKILDGSDTRLEDPFRKSKQRLASALQGVKDSIKEA